MNFRTIGMLMGFGLGSAAGLLAQTQVDLRSQSKQVDFSSAPSTRPAKTGTALPAVCAVGELFFRTNATPGQNLFGCTATNTWIQLSGGGGGGGTTTAWNDMRVTRVSNTQLTIGDTCSLSTPCLIRFGSTIISIQGPITATITAGTGTGLARVYVTEAGVVLVDHSLSAGLTVTCTAGCNTQQTVVPVFPPNSVPLGEVVVTAGAWTSVADMRAALHNRAMAAGQGIVITEAAGVATVEIDTADVARLGGANDWTGANDFGTASVFRVRNGAGLPAGGECNAVAHVGRIYVRNDASAGGSSFYVCANTAAGTYAWELIGGSGGGGGGGGGSSAIDCMSEAAVCLKDDFPYTGTSNAYSELGWRSTTFPSGADWFNNGSRIGVVRLAPAGANTADRMYLDNGGGNGGFLNLSQISAFELVFVWQPETMTANYQYVVGVSNDGSMSGSNAAMFRLANSTGCTSNFSDGTTVQYITNSSGVATTAASGVAVAAGQWLKTRIRKLSGESQLRFSISVNGGAYSADVSLSTNIPATGLMPFFQVTACDGNSQRIYADYFRFTATGVAR